MHCSKNEINAAVVIQADLHSLTYTVPFTQNIFLLVSMYLNPYAVVISINFFFGGYMHPCLG